MKIITGAPGSGKTKRILELSQENNIPIVCESEARSKRLLEKARGYGLSIPNPICFSDASGIEECYVDDCKRLIEAMLNLNLSAITVNVDAKDELIKL